MDTRGGDARREDTTDPAVTNPLESQISASEAKTIRQPYGYLVLPPEAVKMDQKNSGITNQGPPMALAEPHSLLTAKTSLPAPKRNMCTKNRFAHISNGRLAGGKGARVDGGIEVSLRFQPLPFYKYLNAFLFSYCSFERTTPLPLILAPRRHPQSQRQQPLYSTLLLAIAIHATPSLPLDNSNQLLLSTPSSTNSRW